MNQPLASGLAALLSADGGAPVAVSGLQRLSGGASQETWSFEATVHGGRPRGLILRRAPAGAERRGSGNAGLDAEALLIRQAAAAGVPVPEVVAELQPGHGLGQGFVMQRLSGETLGRRIAAAHRPELARQCGVALARIHALPVHGLPPLRRTQPRAEVDHLRAWHTGMGAARPVFQLALRWLQQHAPDDAAPALVHGDFRNGNLMVDLDAPANGADRALVGVLDWELAHVGDPMADLGWLCCNAWRFGQAQRPVGGFGFTDELLAGYRAAGGTPDARRMHWWQVLGSLRWGVICESMGHAWRSGAEPVMEKAAIGRRASENEIDLLDLLLPRPAPGRVLMQDAPHPDQLLEAVVRFLREDALPALGRHGESALAYQARVAANMLEIARRELLQAPAGDVAELARLRALVGEPGEAADLAALNRRLAERIAAGRIDADTPGLAEHLWASTLAKLAVDQPTYETFRRLGGGATEQPEESAMSELVTWRTDGDVAIITLNNPERLNPMSGALQQQLRAQLAHVVADKAVRAVLLTAAGRAFCVGADLTGFTADDSGRSLGQRSADQMHGQSNRLISDMRALPVPVVVAVNGPTAGAGLGLALAGDVVIAARSAYFYLPFMCKLGIVPDLGTTWFYQRLLGTGRATALTLLGDRLPADKAADWGLIWQCVEDAALQDEAMAIARRLAQLPAHAALETRRAYEAAAGHTLDQQMHYEAERQRELLDKPSLAEGVSAFLEKRAPSFAGR